jgi:hypothetical protein
MTLHIAGLASDQAREEAHAANATESLVVTRSFAAFRMTP